MSNILQPDDIQVQSSFSLEKKLTLNQENTDMNLDDTIFSISKKMYKIELS